MRRLVLASFATTLLAACATPTKAPPTPPPLAPTPNETGALTGQTSERLAQRLGVPALQVREGNSLKLQWRGTSCVLDAYLYPQGGVLTAAHIDARTYDGMDTDKNACIAALSAR